MLWKGTLMNIYGKEKEFKSFEQAASNYCGPACIEMLLDYFDLRPNELTSQMLQKKILNYQGDGSLTESKTFKPGQWDDWSPHC